MMTANGCFNDDQKRSVQDAVMEAERKTSAEIVPVVATASGRYDRAEDIVGLVGGVKAMLIAYSILPVDSAGLTGSWEGMDVPFQMPVLIIATVAGFIFAAFVASKIAWLRRLFTPSIQMRDEFNARARQVFYDARVHHTASGSGLLVYISLYERTAVVLADASVTEKLGQPVLDELAKRLIDEIRIGDISTALTNCITAAGEQLASAMPRTSDDVNELSDVLILLD
ncbi:MAG: hypothetical protein AMXMBFR84_44280 [Candidatus Hydrogenedentota bacterium]